MENKLFFHKGDVEEMLSARDKVIWTLIGIIGGFTSFFLLSLAVATIGGLE